MYNASQKIPQSLIPFVGKMMIEEQIVEHKLDPIKLVKQNYIESLESMSKRFLKTTCNRCGNHKRSLLGTIECKRCNRTHLYCRKCIQMGRVLQCSPLYQWIGPEFSYDYQGNPCTWKGTLTDVQSKASARAVQAVVNRENLLIWGVCGAGKTEMLFPAITKSISLGERICIATPRSDVVRELLPRFREAFPSISIQALYSGSEYIYDGAQLTISTTHQLMHYHHAFDTMIIDEVDAFPYHGDDMLPFITHRALKEESTTIYVTATPRKEQHIQMSQGKLPFVFVPRRYHGHDLPVPSVKLLFSLQSSLQKEELPSAFYHWLKQRKHPNRQLLIFVPTIHLAEKVMPHVLQRLSKMKIAFVHAEDEIRKEKVEKFRAKELDVLITTSILERGVTFPAIDVVIIDAGHDVFDESALIQIAGRAGRSASDPTGEVVFFHDGKTRSMVGARKAIIAMNRMK